MARSGLSKLSLCVSVGILLLAFTTAQEEGTKKKIDTTIGIDLGTTYSCVGVYKAGKVGCNVQRCVLKQSLKPILVFSSLVWRTNLAVRIQVEIIANDQGNRITPSYVAFSGEERLVGDAAKNQAALNPENTIFDIKRLIGRKYNDKTVQHDKKLLPYEIISQEGKPFVRVDYMGTKKVFSPEEISAMILVKMKETAESYLGRELKNAVVTVRAPPTELLSILL
jgi:endoplasmic reticulum chaperone BiP